MFDNRYVFKQEFNPLLNYFNIKPVITTINNPQANTTVEWTQQVILNTLVTKYLDNNVFDYIDPWGETFVPISWATRDSYQRTNRDTPGQPVFDRNIIFNLASVVDWQVITTKN